MKFEKYLGNSRCSDLQINDLIALLAGVKTVIYLSASSRENHEHLDQLCADLKLKKVILEDRKNVLGQPVVDLLIGTNVKKLGLAKIAYKNVCSFEWGVALDYPECCVRQYLNWRADFTKKDLVKHISEHSPKGELFPFWTNNVFNYFSRLNLRDGEAAQKNDAGNYRAFMALNQGLDREAIITWHPCSYLCPKSVQKGKQMFEFMVEYLPQTAAYRQEMLSRPIIFWDKFLYAPLNGKCRKSGAGFEVNYQGLGLPKSLISAHSQKALKGPATLHIDAAGLITGQPKPSLPGKYIFLPFAA